MKPKYPLTSTVYLKVNDDMVGMVTGHLFRPNALLYLVRWNDGNEQEHWEAELAEVRTYRGDQT